MERRMNIAGLIYAVQFPRRNLLRLRIRRAGNFRQAEREMVARNPLPALTFKRGENARRIRLAAAGICLEIRKSNGGFAVRNAAGKVVARCPAAPRWMPAGAGRRRSGAGVRRDSGCESGPRPVCFLSLMAGTSARYYGLGSTGGRVELKGSAVDTWIDHFGADDFRAPYYYCTSGYSLFARAAERAVFDFGKTMGARIQIRIDDPDELELFIQTGSAADCIEGYTWLTGRSPALPTWVFGNWMGGYWRDQRHLLATAEAFRRRGIPLDVMRLDSCWQAGHECDFKWDDRYPDPSGMLARLKALGLRLHLWCAHVVNHNCAMFAEGLAKNYFVKNRDVVNEQPASVPLIRWWKPTRGCMVDFTNPAARRWWQALLRPLLKAGVAGFKIDGANECYFVTRERLFHDGRDGRRAHNIYPLLYAACAAEVQRAVHGRPMPLWIRAGYAGIQRYPVLWAGDQPAVYDSILKQIHSALSAGLSGVSFWSSDGGGFAGRPGEELYIRGLQFAFWNAVCQPFGKDREPWLFSERACRVFKACAELRNRLNPYIVAVAARSVRTGLPIMRHLLLEFPDDPEVSGVDDQYCFGPAFLVAPIYRAGGRRQIYFPRGEWVDLYSGRLIAGPARKTYVTDVEALPVFARCGYVVPLKPLSRFVEERSGERLRLYRWQGHDGSACWHDGISGARIAGVSAACAERDLETFWRKRFGRAAQAMPLNRNVFV